MEKTYTFSNIYTRKTIVTVKYPDTVTPLVSFNVEVGISTDINKPLMISLAFNAPVYYNGMIYNAGTCISKSCIPEEGRCNIEFSNIKLLDPFISTLLCNFSLYFEDPNTKLWYLIGSGSFSINVEKAEDTGKLVIENVNVNYLGTSTFLGGSDIYEICVKSHCIDGNVYLPILWVEASEEAYYTYINNVDNQINDSQYIWILDPTSGKIITFGTRSRIYGWNSNYPLIRLEPCNSLETCFKIIIPLPPYEKKFTYKICSGYIRLDSWWSIFTNRRKYLSPSDFVLTDCKEVSLVSPHPHTTPTKPSASTKPTIRPSRPIITHAPPPSKSNIEFNIENINVSASGNYAVLTVTAHVDKGTIIGPMICLEYVNGPSLYVNVNGTKVKAAAKGWFYQAVYCDVRYGKYSTCFTMTSTFTIELPEGKYGTYIFKVRTGYVTATPSGEKFVTLDCYIVEIPYYPSTVPQPSPTVIISPSIVTKHPLVIDFIDLEPPVIYYGQSSRLIIRIRNLTYNTYRAFLDIHNLTSIPLYVTYSTPFGEQTKETDISRKIRLIFYIQPIEVKTFTFMLRPDWAKIRTRQAIPIQLEVGHFTTT